MIYSFIYNYKPIIVPRQNGLTPKRSTQKWPRQNVWVQYTVCMMNTVFSFQNFFKTKIIIMSIYEKI
jgi:hypothetical protein